MYISYNLGNIVLESGQSQMKIIFFHLIHNFSACIYSHFKSGFNT